MNFLTKTQAQKLCETSQKKKSYHVGELYPEIFSHDENLTFNEETKLNVALIYVGAFELENNVFSKIKCPICGKEEAIPYFCGASILSGAHVLKFHCLNCKELIATNDLKEYYHSIRNYIVKNKNNLPISKTLKTYVESSP